MRRLVGTVGFGVGSASIACIARIACIACIACIVCVVGAPLGCVQPFSTQGAGGGTGGGSVASTDASTGGAKSTAASTASSGTGGSGGSVPPCTAGMGVEASSCGQGRYCDTSAGVCAECAALDRLQLGAPVPLGLAPTSGITQMFPRSNADTGDLFLVLQAMQPVYQTQIASAVAVKGPPSWMPPAPLMALAGTNQDTGPLYLQSTATLAGLVDASVSKAAEPALLFDSDRIPGKREVFALLLGSMAIPVPVVLALPGGGTATNESNIAVAPGASPPRYFWLSDAGAQPLRLVTAVASDASPADLPITLDDGCPVPLAAMPWVTPGGEWILFASTRPDPASNCAAPPADAPTHLYAARLNAHGQQTGKAVPLFGAADANLDNSPSLWTPSLCALLFTRFDATTGIGAIYAAQRD